jgi:hypothetical protein
MVAHPQLFNDINKNMNIQDLPDSLLKASKKIVETQDVLESCTSCGAVIGSCSHSDGLSEDILSSMNVPDEDEPEAQLSGEVEDVIINPEYKTFTPKHR